MRRFLRLAPLVAVMVLGLAVGLPQAGAIINGTPDDGTTPRYPNVGVVYNENNPWYYGFCSGTLISETVFLTAGHCTSAFLPANSAHIRISFDAHLTVSSEDTIVTSTPLQVDGWETHPGYVEPPPNSGTVRLLNDVGVFFLKDRVEGVTPAELPPYAGFLNDAAAKGGLVGHAFDIAGYGLNSYHGGTFFHDTHASFTWNKEREFSTTLFKALTPNNLAVGTGTCYADSGSPKFFGGEQPNLEVAVTSGGDPTCGSLDNSQRLDTPSVLGWLQQILADNP